MYTDTESSQIGKGNSVRIVNKTAEPLNNIKLIFEDLNINILEYKVVRERGSLSYTPPLKLIELGNLFPDETAELYFKVDTSDMNDTLPHIPLDTIQISYSLDDEKPIHLDLNTFLSNNK